MADEQVERRCCAPRRAPTTSCGPSRAAGRRSSPRSPAGPGGPASGWCSTPMFEDARLFRRGIGDESDVVRKEMYEFADRGGRRAGAAARGHRLGRAGLRPAPPARAVEGVVRDAGVPLRAAPGRPLQPAPPAGVEVLGTEDPDLDVEVIALAAGFYAELGPAPGRPGASTPWAAPSAAPRTWPRCVAYLAEHADELCDEHRERFAANPLRVLDCKRPECRAVTEDAPRHRRLPRRGLRRPPRPGAGGARRARHRPPARAPAGAGPRLLHAHHLRVRRRRRSTPAQNAVGGGGRYDGLAEAIGGPPTPGHRLRHRHRAAAAGLRRRGRASPVDPRRPTPSWST